MVKPSGIKFKFFLPRFSFKKSKQGQGLAALAFLFNPCHDKIVNLVVDAGRFDRVGKDSDNIVCIVAVFPYG